MGKDPAFLFYSSDFLTGTMLMSDGQVGKYIRLLCLQHQKGRMAKKDMLKVCGGYDEDIFREFAQDEKGLYYNTRLDDEIKRRASYCESRRKNRSTKETDTDSSKTEGIHDSNNICESHDEHMETETETENKADKKGKAVIRFAPPSVEEVRAYCEKRKNGIDAEAFVAHYRSKGWKVGSAPMKDWEAAVITWERRRAEQARASPDKEAPEQYRF